MNPQGEGRISEYEFRDGKTVWVRKGVESPIVLANFTARIVREIELDDGGGAPSLSFEVEAATHNKKRTSRLLAADFEFMQWPIRTLGATAIIQPGPGIRERLRVAIQENSGDVERVRVYAHTGWTLLPDGRAVYLHAEGGIGAAGAVRDVQVQLPESLQAMALPLPPSLADAQQAVRESLRLADVGAPQLVIPCLAGVHRAVLGDTPFTIAIVGPTGVFKTEFAAVCQQHWGHKFGVSRLLSWTSTGNYLEEIAFVAKDALSVFDDFAPIGMNGDSALLNGRADRVLRAVGNRSGRGRMRSDLSLRPTHAPRGLVILTGEELPLGQSLRARCLAIDVGHGDISQEKLTRCQAHAASGIYALATAGYVQWLADKIFAIQKRLPAEVAKLRGEMAASGRHRRTSEIVANLEIGFRYFLEYAVAIEAIDHEAGVRLLHRCREALHQLAAAQERHQEDANPESVFVDLVRVALGSGRAHLAAIDGTAPQNPQGWGWVPRPGGFDGNRSPMLDSKGERIGWVDAKGVYLLSEAAFAVASRMARDQGTRMATGLRTLERRLYELGLIAQIETRGGTRRFLVRKTIQGVQRSVLHLHPDVLFGPKPDLQAPAVEMEPPAADRANAPTMGDSPAKGPSDQSSDA